MRLNVIQGSQEWIEFRRNKLGASDLAAALGVSKFMPKNLKELVEVKKGIRTVYYSQAMRDGNNYEARARELAEAHFGEMFEPHTYLEDERGVLIASLDGISMDETIGIEIKVSDKPLAELEAQYMWQMQQQLMVSPIVANYLVAYRKGTDTIEVSEAKYYSKVCGESILEAEKAFVKAMAGFDPDVVNVEQILIDEYLEAEAIEEETKKVKASIKAKWQEKYKEGFKNDRLTFYKSKGKTTVDYKTAIAENLPDLDLAKYTKVGTDSWAVKVANTN